MTEQDWYVYGAIALLTICTVLTRSTFHVIGHKIPLSEGVRSGFRYAPAAALTAIIVPELLPLSSEAGGVIVDQRLLAALVAVWIFHKTRNTMLMIVGGMVVF